MKNMIKRIVCGLFAVLLFVVTSVTAFAADEDVTLRTVRVGVGFSNAIYLDDAGKPQGYCSHFIRQIAWLENWNLEYVEVTWAEGLEKMKDGELDLLFPVQMSDERKEYLDYSIYNGGFESVGLYARADSNVSFDEYDALDGKCIGVEANNMCGQDLGLFAKEHNLSYTTKEFATADELHKSLEQGAVDMIVSSTMNTIPNSTLVAVIDYIPFYYCTAKGNTELMNELTDGMRDTMTNNPGMALDVYKATLSGTAEVGYTKEEKQVIANTDKIVFAMYDNSLPLSGMNTDGEPIGIYVDLLKQIEKITGITMEAYIVPTDKSIFDDLYNGKANYIMCSNRLPYALADTSKLLGSDPIIDYTIVGVSRPEYNPETSENAIVALENCCTYLESYITSEYPNATIQYYPTSKECMVAVQSGKANMTFINSWEYNYHSKNSRFRGLMQWENTRISSSVIVVTTSDNNDAWLNIVDKAFHKINDEEKENIIAQNVNMLYISYDVADKMYDIWNNAKVVVTVLLFVVILFGVYLYMRHKSISALKAKNQELEEANEAKSEFLSRMSHELRTPLNAINGYATVMDQDIVNHHYEEKKAHTYMLSIIQAVKYQLSIVGNLLEIQKIESGKIDISAVEVDFADYMDNIVAMIAPEAKTKGVEFTYERLSKVKDTYILDGVRLQQVLLNLLHNAVKFTPVDGKVKMTAEVIEQNEKINTLKFVIADTGIGISEEFQKNYLFQRFAQEHKGNTSPYEGCGTGLAISREIIHLMGGELICQSKQGEGSTFTVILTARHKQKKRKRAAKQDYSAYNLSGMRILLCEDNKMNQDMERRLLEKMYCIVDIAADGQIGVNMFEQSTEEFYDVILMDIRMPNMDGLEATRTIRQMPREDAKKIPILAVSANSFEEDVQKSLEAGMNEHLAKPVNVKILYDKIKEYCK